MIKYPYTYKTKGCNYSHGSYFNNDWAKPSLELLVRWLIISHRKSRLWWPIYDLSCNVGCVIKCDNRYLLMCPWRSKIDIISEERPNWDQDAHFRTQDAIIEIELYWKMSYISFQAVSVNKITTHPFWSLRPPPPFAVYSVLCVYVILYW